jgi:hypothetical protein
MDGVDDFDVVPPAHAVTGTEILSEGRTGQEPDVRRCGEA